jgi:hypothetical protein
VGSLFIHQKPLRQAEQLPTLITDKASERSTKSHETSRNTPALTSDF